MVNVDYTCRTSATLLPIFFGEGQRCIRYLLNCGWCPEGKEAAGKESITFYTAVAVRNLNKIKIECKEKLLWRHEKVEVKIAYAAALIVMNVVLNNIVF